MKTFKEYIENPLNEASKSDFTAGYEKSKFGGYRAEVRNRGGKVSYLGQTAYKTPEAAKGEAEVYIKADGESGGNDRKIMGAVTQYQKQNKEFLREESLNETPTKINTRTWNIHEVTLANLKQELLKGSNAKFAERVVSIVKQEPTKYGWIITCLMEDNNEVANKVEFVISVKEVDVSMI